MTITRPCYVTREAVKRALDVAETARADDRVDRAIESATEDVDGILKRTFVPTIATRYFDWPEMDGHQRNPWRLWLDGDEVISVTSLTAGGTTISASDYNLEPVNDGPPYTRIETDLSSTASFQAGDTHQRAIAVTGTFAGCPLTTATAGALAEALDASETSVDVTDSSAVGVGDLIKVDSEYLLVTGKSMLSTGQTTTVAAQTSAVTVAVSDGTAFTVGETILLDSERMLIVDIAGNNLTAKRAWDGSVLAAHSGSTIYAPRTLTVVRAAQGSTAATHTTSTAVARHVPPPRVRDLALALALNQLLQEQAGYARTSGTGDHQREITGRGLASIEAAALQSHGRQFRTVAV